MLMSIGDIYAAHGSTVIAGSNHVISCEHAKDDLRRCVDALFITNPDIDKQEILDSTGGLVEGTCEWIRSEDKCRTWLESEESELLCIFGGPGEDDALHFPYWRVSGSHAIFVRKSCVPLLRSPRSKKYGEISPTNLASRHFIRNSALAKHAAKCMMATGKMEYALGSLGTLWQIFAHTLKDPDLDPLYCALDGLDECPEGDKKWLVGKIQTLFENRSGACHQSPNISKIVTLSGGIGGVRGSHYLNLDQCSGRALRALYPGLNYGPRCPGERQDDVWLVIKARLGTHAKVEEFDEGFWLKLGETLRKLSEGLFS
ncbi:hypothetical protein Landi51_12812 [Colletotrichum acutatum]